MTPERIAELRAVAGPLANDETMYPFQPDRVTAMGFARGVMECLDEIERLQKNSRKIARHVLEEVLDYCNDFPFPCGYQRPDGSVVEYTERDLECVKTGRYEILEAISVLIGPMAIHRKYGSDTSQPSDAP